MTATHNVAYVKGRKCMGEDTSNAHPAHLLKANTYPSIQFSGSFYMPQSSAALQFHRQTMQ